MKVNNYRNMRLPFKNCCSLKMTDIFLQEIISLQININIINNLWSLCLLRNKGPPPVWKSITITRSCGPSLESIMHSMRTTRSPANHCVTTVQSANAMLELPPSENAVCVRILSTVCFRQFRGKRRRIHRNKTNKPFRLQGCTKCNCLITTWLSCDYA